MPKEKPSKKYHYDTLKNRNRYFKKYKIFQQHHFPGLVFLFHASRSNEADLSVSYLIILGSIYIYVNSGKRGSRAIFCQSQIHTLITTTFDVRYVRSAFKHLLDRGVIKKLTRGKYMLTNKGVRVIKSISIKFSRMFYEFEREHGNLNFL